MPQVKLRHNYGLLIYSSHMEHGEVVPALLKSGECTYIPFGTFVKEITGQRVKIPNVCFYSQHDSTDWETHELPKGSIVIGEYKNKRINILWPLVHYLPE